MEIQEILDYIEKTPANTNPNVLSTMLAELGGGGAAATYVHSIEVKGGTQGSDPGDKYVNFFFEVYSHDSSPATTMQELLQIMPQDVFVAADGEYTEMIVGGANSQMFVQVRCDDDTLYGTFAYFENESLIKVESDEEITDLWDVECTITDTVMEF